MTVADKIHKSSLLRISSIKVRAAREAASVLRSLRETAKLSQKDLAKLLGVSQARISQVESGKVETLPAYDFMCVYADACGGKISLTSLRGFDKYSNILESSVEKSGSEITSFWVRQRIVGYSLSEEKLRPYQYFTINYGNEAQKLQPQRSKTVREIKQNR